MEEKVTFLETVDDYQVNIGRYNAVVVMNGVLKPSVNDLLAIAHIAYVFDRIIVTNNNPNGDIKCHLINISEEYDFYYLWKKYSHSIIRNSYLSDMTDTEVSYISDSIEKYIRDNVEGSNLLAMVAANFDTTPNEVIDYMYSTLCFASDKVIREFFSTIDMLKKYILSTVNIYDNKDIMLIDGNEDITNPGIYIRHIKDGNLSIIKKIHFVVHYDHMDDKWRLSYVYGKDGKPKTELPDGTLMESDSAIELVANLSKCLHQKI